MGQHRTDGLSHFMTALAGTLLLCTPTPPCASRQHTSDCGADPRLACRQHRGGRLSSWTKSAPHSCPSCTCGSWPSSQSRPPGMQPAWPSPAPALSGPWCGPLDADFHQCTSMSSDLQMMTCDDICSHAWPPLPLQLGTAGLHARSVAWQLVSRCISATLGMLTGLCVASQLDAWL